MIRYNPKSWFDVLFGIVRSGVFRTLFLDMVGVGLYAAVVVWLERDVGRIPQPFGIPALSLFGIILGLSLVFRTNTAYDRWWEGRRLWGQMVNTSRAFSRQLHAQLPEAMSERRRHYARLLCAFPPALAEHLREPRGKGRAQVGDAIDSSAQQQADQVLQEAEELLVGARHRPGRLIGMMVSSVHQDVREGNLRDHAAISLVPLLTVFDDVMGACERIRNTPIPFGYSAYIKQFVLLFALISPFAMAPDFGYGTVLATMLFFFSTMGLELLATEIEDPFGFDPNDLPLAEISKRIHADVNETLVPAAD